MITISEIKTYAETLKDRIEAINRIEIVVDDSQLAARTKDISAKDKIVLVGFIPSHKPEGNNFDVIMSTDSCLWLLLQKNDPKDGHDKFIQTMSEVQNATREVLKWMIADKTDHTDGCSLMKFLQPGSLSIDPVWGLNGSDGYEINFSLKTNLWH